MCIGMSVMSHGSSFIISSYIGINTTQIYILYTTVIQVPSFAPWIL